MNALVLPQLTKGEQRIRKIWNIINLIPLGILLLILLIIPCIGLYADSLTSDEIGEFFLEMLLPIALAGMTYGIQYHCIYRKYGTLLLSFFTLCYLLKTAGYVFFFITLSLRIFTEQGFPYPFLLLSIGSLVIAIEVFVLYIMFTLHYINKKSQFQLESYEGYTQALSDLAQAPDLEQLKLVHLRLWKDWPLFRRVLKRAFKERESELKVS